MSRSNTKRLSKRREHRRTYEKLRNIRRNSRPGMGSGAGVAGQIDTGQAMRLAMGILHGQRKV